MHITLLFACKYIARHRCSIIKKHSSISTGYIIFSLTFFLESLGGSQVHERNIIHSSEESGPEFTCRNYDNIILLHCIYMTRGGVILCTDVVTQWLLTHESVTAEKQLALLTILTFYSTVVGTRKNWESSHGLPSATQRFCNLWTWSCPQNKKLFSSTCSKSPKHLVCSAAPQAASPTHLCLVQKF